MPDERIVEMLDRHGHECAIAAPVWHELVFGCRRLPVGRKRTAIENYLTDVVHASFPILPYDESAADWLGLERARLEAHGRSVPFVDGQIAAISNVNGLVLVTGNTRDFKHFKGLELENWGKRRLQQ